MEREEIIQLIYLAKKWNKFANVEGYDYDELIALWEDTIAEMETTK